MHAVFPGDFFSFLVGAARVGDRNFVDAPTVFGDFGCDFGFEAEAVGANLDALQYFLAKNFVAGFHVREFQVGGDVGEQGEEFVGDVVPEIVDALRAAEKAGAEDDIGPAVEDRLEQLGIVAGVVSEIGILDKDDFAGGFGEAAAQGGAFALVLRLKEKTQIAEFDGIVAVVGGGGVFAAGLASGEAFEDLPGAVGGTIVDGRSARLRERCYQSWPGNERWFRQAFASRRDQIE